MAFEVVTQAWGETGYLTPGPRKVTFHFLTLVEAYSEFMILSMVKNTKSLATVEHLNRCLFSYFRFPKFLVTDNIRHFKSMIFAYICSGNTLQLIFTNITLIHLMHKRVNKNVKVALCIFQSQDHTALNTNLHWLQLEFYCSWHVSTIWSLLTFLLGCQIRHTLELQWNLDIFLAVSWGQLGVHHMECSKK